MEKQNFTKTQVMINNLQRFVTLPDSNDKELQHKLLHLALMSAMKSHSTSVHKNLSKEFKELHKEAIETMPPNQVTELEFCYPFCLQVKKSKPRSQFDKSLFIKKVAEEYDLSITELTKLANTCNKETASPISFEVVHDEGNANG